MAHNHTPSEIAIRIMVAYRSYHKEVTLISTNIAAALVKVLYEQGLIEYFTIGNEGINVRLKYIKGKPFWKSIKTVSTPGRRVYWTVEDIRKIYSKKGFGKIYIISTPQGLYTTPECVLGLNSGGEVIYKIELL